jgi:zinc transport system substrate-binding protein
MKSITIALLLTCLIIIGAFGAGCSLTGPPRQNSSQIKVLVTVLPEAGYAKAVGGERTEVLVVVPPGADPHTFEPSVKEMEKFSDADIYFTLNKGTLPLEDNLVTRLSSMNPRMKVIETAPGIEFLSGQEEQDEVKNEENQGSGATVAGHSHEGLDPHVWVSLKNTKLMVNHMYDALASADPAYAPYYLANRDTILANITLMDNEITSMLNKTPRKKFIASHASWGYFARDYGLDQVIIGKPGKEATSKDIEMLIRMAREENITLIITEPQYSRKAAEMIANSINGSIVIADPLAPDMPQELQRLAITLSRTGLN